MTAILTIIGGGSAYTPGLMLALCQSSLSHPITRVHLYDTHAAHLDIVQRLCSKMGAHAERPIEVHAFERLPEAVSGASFVLNSARPGGLQARTLDETLPLEFGIPGQETVGPGGLFFALRSVPRALELAQCMLERAPEAVLLNYTNPTNVVCQALYDAGYRRERGLEVVGLCDQCDEDLQVLSDALHTGRGEGDPSDLGRPKFQCAGLNHATWYSAIDWGDHQFEGVEGRPAVPEGLDAEHALRFELSLAMVRKLPGWWPNSYLPYYHYPRQFAELLAGVTPRSRVIRATMPDYFAHFEAEAAKDRPRLTMHRGSSGFGDLALRYIVAHSRGDADAIVLNLPNGSFDASFDPDTIVECSAQVEPGGARPLGPAPLPAGDRALLGRLERYQRAAARAARELDTANLVEALAHNPLVPDDATARAMAERAKRQYAPYVEFSA